MNYVSNNLKSGDKSGVVVGSGYLYACIADEIADRYNLTAEDLEKFDEIGYIEADAVLTANATSVDLSTANYGKIGKIYSDKKVSFVTGIISWNLEHISKYLTGSEYETTEDGKTRFYYGVDDRAPRVCLRFVSEDDREGKKIVIVMPLAQFQGELEMNFNADNPVSFNYAFDLMSTVNMEKQKSYYFYMDEVNGNGANVMKIMPQGEKVGYGDKMASDLFDSNVKIAWDGVTGVVTGNFKNITEWTELPKDPKSGHFFAMTLDEKYKGKPFTHETDTTSTHTDSAGDDEMFWVLCIDDNKHHTFKSGDEIIAKLDFTRATLDK